MHEKMGWEAYKAMLEVPYFIRTAIEKQAARFSVIDPVSEKINGWLDESSPELVCVEQAATEAAHTKTSTGAITRTERGARFRTS